MTSDKKTPHAISRDTAGDISSSFFFKKKFLLFLMNLGLSDGRQALWCLVPLANPTQDFRMEALETPACTGT